MLDLNLMGKSNVQIAEELEMTTVTVSSFLTSPLAQHELARRRNKIEKIQNEVIGQSVTRAMDILNEEAEANVRKLIELRDNSVDENIQMKSSNSMLDRVFGSDAKKGDGANIKVFINGPLMIQTMEEEKKIKSLLVEQEIQQNPEPPQNQNDTGSDPVSDSSTSDSGMDKSSDVTTAAA